MNWKLTNAAINGTPAIDDWSDWGILFEEHRQDPKVAMKRLKDLADVPDSGVTKVGEGRYLFKY